MPIGVAFAFSTSLAIILPPSPLPARVLRSIPLSLAIFLANGLAIILPVFNTGAASCVGAGVLLVGAAIGALAFADDASVFLPAFIIVSKYGAKSKPAGPTTAIVPFTGTASPA